MGASIWSSRQEACSLSFARNRGALLLLQSMQQGAGPALGERENWLEETVTEAQETRRGPKRSSQNMLQGVDGNTALDKG